MTYHMSAPDGEPEGSDVARFVEEAPKDGQTRVADAGRSPFSRDRARVLHSAGFRRLAAKTQVLAGADQMTFVDIDSLLRRVYGSKKRGAVRAGQGRRLSTLTARSVAIWWPRSPRHGRLR